MSGRVLRFLAVVVLACVVKQDLVLSQCTTRYCDSEYSETDVWAMVRRLHRQLGNLEGDYEKEKIRNQKAIEELQQQIALLTETKKTTMPTTTRPRKTTTTTKPATGAPSSIVYTKNGDKCVFPFNAFGNTFYNCTTDYVTVMEPWCSLTGDYDRDRKMGYCDFNKTAACGDFTKLENRFAYDGVEVVAATLEDCKKSCLDNITCLGFDFSIRANCYLGFDETSFNDVYSGDGVDHYIRQFCPTTPPE